MWQQEYLPIADSLAWSALAAALPIFVLLLLIGVLRKPAWIAALSGLAAAAVVCCSTRRPQPSAYRSVSTAKTPTDRVESPQSRVESQNCSIAMYCELLTLDS